MREELEPFEESFEEEIVEERLSLTLRAGSIDGVLVKLVVSGIGTTNAAIAATLLIERGCTTIVMSGAAGSIRGEIGDVYASKACVYHDVDATAFGYAPGQVPAEPERFVADPRLLEVAVDAGAREGVFASGNAFVSDPESVTRIRDVFGAELIDMESCAIAHVCTHAGATWLIVRGVSDRADAEAKDSFEKRLEMAAKNAAACTIRIVGALSSR